jgi:hypothetical protein
MPATVHRTVADGMTILGLPGKIGNANTKASYESRRFFAPENVRWTLSDGATIPGLPGKIGNANTGNHALYHGAFVYTAIENFIQKLVNCNFRVVNSIKMIYNKLINEYENWSCSFYGEQFSCDSKLHSAG